MNFIKDTRFVLLIGATLIGVSFTGWLYTNFSTQFIGVISVCVFSFVLSYAVFRTLKETIGLRISKSAERLGTDKAEVGVSAYSIRD